MIRPVAEGDLEAAERWALFSPIVDGPLQGIVAVEDGEVVGYLTFLRRERHEVELHVMEVRPDKRGEGIGTRLVATAAEGAVSIVAICTCEHGPRFFTALGFRPIGDFADMGLDLDRPLCGVGDLEAQRGHR